MKKSISISVCLFILLIPMLLHADYVTEGARYGLLLWYNSVVPALFPFMVLSGLIVSGGGVSVIMTPFYKILHPLLGLSGNGCYVLISGLLCGCPMGAKTCADFIRENRITLPEGKLLLAICNHPSPMFLLGYVYPFFSSEIRVWEIVICVYLPVVILAAAARRIYCPETIADMDESDKTAASGRRQARKDSSRNMSADETILSAVEILCKIGGYLVLFSILIVFLRYETRLPVPLKLAVTGILEMTTGIRELASTLHGAPAFCSSVAALTFGGISGLFQTKAVLSVPASGNESTAGLSIRPYFFWKLVHASLSAGLAYFLCIMH